MRARLPRRLALLTAAVLGAAILPLVSTGTAAAATLGNITAFTPNGSTYEISAGTPKVRVSFAQPGVFRLWLAPTGTFSDPVGGKIAIKTDFGAVNTTWSDAGTYYRMNTSAVTLRAYKSPLRFELYRADNTTPVWKESTGLTWQTGSATQNLVRGADEQFYGTGFRLGAWALRDLSVPVAVDNTWREGKNASPAPFYLSTNGYGVVRNTWAPGQYDFMSTVGLRHNETRFDAFYFVGDGPKDVLNRYTDVTGKPFLAPIWGFEMGNADCWNASNPDYQGDHNRIDHQTTPDVVKYADQAIAADMPSGWFLPNDGYGCGYKDLTNVVSQLQSRGMKTGLWTSTGLSNIGNEVGVSGSRAVKTDVAWIGPGYQMAFDGVQQAVNGIENNSDARRFVWTVDGWAGTQRNAVVWSGDTHGTWADMRWHVPAIAGAGLSALNYAAGDVDGIFDGSAKTYARDLQWKAFTPALMTMSGWGPTNPSTGFSDKQPWRWAEPTLSINRKYLKLKMRLTPYLYSMSRVATETGTPSTRAMVLEYPNDPVARGNETSQQFMSGDAFLVAPVTSDTTVRDGIYLPAGTWTDYWTGKTYAGPGWLNGYNAPLDTLPLFVKGGGIVPMWPQMNRSGEKPATPITYDVYPRGTSTFSLYEDDGLTRSYQTGAFAKQKVDVTAPTSGAGDVRIQVGASVGSYTGKLANRGYDFAVHVASAPTAVTLGTTTLVKHTTKSAYDSATTGWFFDPADRAGVLHVKTGTQSTSTAFTVTATGTTLPAANAIPTGSQPIPKAGQTVLSVDSQETGQPGSNAIDGNTGTLWHTAWSNVDPDPAPPHEIKVDLGASYQVDGLRYLPRQDGGVNGTIGQYEVYVSDNSTTWGTPVSTGTFSGGTTEKALSFTAKTGRYVRLRALSEVNGGPWTSVAEITTLGKPAAVSAPIPKAGQSIVSASSQQTGEPASNAIDGNTATIWHTKWSGGADPLPHEVQINLGASYQIDGLRYLPRQDGGVNGTIGQYEVYVSDSTTSWGTPVATGTFSGGTTEKTLSFTAKTGRYLRLRALSEVNGGPWTSAAEITAVGR
ncbi:Alpha-glucosidase, glycosyl hydrolase family GH31 [Actinokineospora alba]|uniref:Alpha-glucosidase, glycosyl hydrolase family GH31 n=1 Tax=Actinokineospora alba TaxID=504798 RepID=A0A1H0R8U5_9PSEU|nr:discoidin domain-containing protein [Actinokineospora alba]TDP70199.1 alpha-glucosidase (family GH31 glycosyl hydrolase) [Actinokineospora alba]SDI36966.1 Alpha-glucosidase, glycosyl hydrolase family GH31 [Actinokineospora alba]SDP25860.1 Alpha-glucosidase, glycosyl hydrolase family GH31 [Actinokineospora alba]